MKEEVNKEQKRKKRKFSPLIFLAFLFILSGIATLVYPIVGNYLANHDRSEATSHYDQALNKLSKNDLEKQVKEAEKYNANIFATQTGHVQPYPAVTYEKIANQDGVMGTLDIPAISIKAMPFYHGTDELTLNRGLGHFKPSTIPVGGKNTRSVIAGHSGLENQVLFTNVRKLQVGDLFYINILGKRLAYQIKSLDEVLPSDVDKVKIKPGKDMVTLVTCTPPGINTYRLLVNGERIPLETASKEKVSSRDKLSYTNIVLGSLIGAALLFILLFVLYRLLLRRFKRAEEGEAKEKAARHLKRLFFAIKAFFVLLIVVMIGVLCFALYGYSQIQSQESMGSIDIGKQEQLANYNLDKINKANYTEDDISSVNTGAYTDSKINFNQAVNDWGIGKLSIPSQAMDLPILAGMSNENLMNGASTYRGEQQLGKGNYVLLAHNIIGQNGPLDVLFWRLVNLKEGDLIYASDFKNVYTYRVTRNEVINQREVSVLEESSSTKNRPIITMIRCEGGIGTPLRRVVQGEFVKSSPLAEKDLKLLNLKKDTQENKGKIYKTETYPSYRRLSMEVSAGILSDPLQTIVPIFLLLIIPILFLNLI